MKEKIRTRTACSSGRGASSGQLATVESAAKELLLCTTPGNAATLVYTLQLYKLLHAFLNPKLS